jgi:hypothetical protein
MKNNDENELLRSTGKNGEKRNVSDPFSDTTRQMEVVEEEK